MNTTTHRQSLATSFTGRVATLVSPETRQLVELGRQKGWDSNVLGRASLPSAPVRLGDWLIVPAHLDSSPIPERALQRVQSVFEAGLRPKGFVLVHEAPKLLPGPTQDQNDTLRIYALPDNIANVLKVVGSALGILALFLVGAAGLMILALAAATLATILVLPAILAVGAALVDPILVAVTEDGYWIEIDRWWN